MKEKQVQKLSEPFHFILCSFIHWHIHNYYHYSPFYSLYSFIIDFCFTISPYPRFLPSFLTFFLPRSFLLFSCSSVAIHSHFDSTWCRCQAADINPSIPPSNGVKGWTLATPDNLQGHSHSCTRDVLSSPATSLTGRIHSSRKINPQQRPIDLWRRWRWATCIQIKKRPILHS